MKLFFAVVTISFALLVSVQSCRRCYKCKRIDLEAQCIKPNDTVVFDQEVSRYSLFHRYYSGGDSFFHHASSRLDYTVQNWTDSGYNCSVYATGHISEFKLCDGGDNPHYIPVHVWEGWGYTCHK